MTDKQTVTTAAEWARETTREQRRQGAAKTQRVGKSVLIEDPDTGDVMIMSPDRAAINLTEALTPADEVTGTPDAAYFAAKRTTTSTATATAGFQEFAGDWYDATDYEPSFWDWDSPTNTLTLRLQAPTLLGVTVAQAFNPALIGDHLFAVAVFKNGDRAGVSTTVEYRDEDVSGVFQISHTFWLPAGADDAITPGYWSMDTSLAALAADTDGINTRFEVFAAMPL